VIAMPVRTEVLMGTLVTIKVAADGADDAVERAFGWFREVEARCTRFDASSELMQLSSDVGRPFAVSAILFEAVRFALSVAEDTAGAFDPTVGARVAACGFDREHRTGRRVAASVAAADDVSYRDVEIDNEHRTITLRRPLTLDLGAVAKGLAVDAAARELRSAGDFAIDAGGDLYCGGRNSHGGPWSVGIRHPRRDDELIASLRISDMAVCTSGDYERPGHIVDPRQRSSADEAVASATVIAPSAMLADALATAAFVLGPVEGMKLLERHQVDGLIVTASLERFATAGLRRFEEARLGADAAES